MVMEVLSILESISDLNWKRIDCVEVLTTYDVSQITALAGATVVWMYLGYLLKR
jgi:agmatinase